METPAKNELPHLLSRALGCRFASLEESHISAVRIFNGFTEGLPSLVVDLYGRTLVFFIQKADEEEKDWIVHTAREFYLSMLDWVDCIVLKQRSSPNEAKKRGEVICGTQPATRIIENGVTYAVDLMLNQDAGFYLDTRNLRAWLKTEADGKTLFNTFAYTGSLGVAALAGGAEQVTQIDRNGKFLKLAKESVRLNGFDAARMTCTAVDFFVAVGQMKHSGKSYDMVILDPPFFSITQRGKVDLVNEVKRLVNKARPLVKDGGRLVLVNNALYLSGREFIRALEDLGRDGYVSIETIIPVAEDVTGYADTKVLKAPTDPAPFNHPTKIVVLSVRRK